MSVCQKETRQPAIPAYLVPYDGFLDSSEVLKRGEKDMTPLRATDVVDEAAQLFAQSDEDLILIFDRLCDTLLETCWCVYLHTQKAVEG